MLKFSKGCCSPRFHSVSTKSYRKHVFGKNAGYYFFSGNLPNFKSIIYSTLKIHVSYLSCIARIHKAMLTSFGKRSSRASRPLGLLLLFLFYRGVKHINLHRLSLTRTWCQAAERTIKDTGSERHRGHVQINTAPPSPPNMSTLPLSPIDVVTPEPLDHKLISPYSA